jgi:hypothetical protein
MRIPGFAIDESTLGRGFASLAALCQNFQAAGLSVLAGEASLIHGKQILNLTS